MIKAAYGIFETADGWLGLVGVPPHARDGFFIAIERPDLALDERLKGIALPPEDLAWFKGELAATFKTRTTAAWGEVLGAAGVRYAPVQDYAAAAADPGIWENGYLTEVADDAGLTQRVVGTPIRMGATPLSPGVQAPSLGEHTEEVLREIGIEADEMATLREQGTI